MSDSAERWCIGIILILMMLGYQIITNNHLDDIESQLATYQDSVNVLIEVNKKLHAAQTMYSDAIVFVMGVKPTDFDELRQRYEDAVKKATASIENYRKFMTLQEVEK